MPREVLSLSSRGQLERLMRKNRVPIRMADIEDADQWIDEALTVLETEEPTLLKWVSETDGMNGALRANSIAIFATIQNSVMNGEPISRTLRRIDFFNYRLSCAVAWHAAQHEREQMGDQT